MAYNANIKKVARLIVSGRDRPDREIQKRLVRQVALDLGVTDHTQIKGQLICWGHSIESARELILTIWPDY